MTSAQQIEQLKPENGHRDTDYHKNLLLLQKSVGTQAGLYQKRSADGLVQKGRGKVFDSRVKNRVKSRVKVLGIIKENSAITIPEIAQTLGLSIKGVEKIIRTRSFATHRPRQRRALGSTLRGFQLGAVVAKDEIKVTDTFTNLKDPLPRPLPEKAFISISFCSTRGWRY